MNKHMPSVCMCEYLYLPPMNDDSYIMDDVKLRYQQGRTELSQKPGSSARGVTPAAVLETLARMFPHSNVQSCQLVLHERTLKDLQHLSYVFSIRV